MIQLNVPIIQGSRCDFYSIQMFNENKHLINYNNFHYRIKQYDAYRHEEPYIMKEIIRLHNIYSTNTIV